MNPRLQASSSEPKDTPSSNHWERLFRQVDPAIMEVLPNEAFWKRLDRKLVVWLNNTVAQFPWFNQLTLASAIYSDSGAIHQLSLVDGLHAFLRWAIPARYPTVFSLKPAEALTEYFGDPPHVRGVTAWGAYSAVQLHTQRYLESLSPEARARLHPFIFPQLVDTGRLSQLRSDTSLRRQAKRKEQAFAVVRDLPALVVMGRRRYKWVADLDAQVQHIAEAVAQQQLSLPALIRCLDLDNRHELTFRVWDRASWVQAHKKGYAESTRSHHRHLDGLFLQLIGVLPDTPWFLRAAQVGALSSRGKRDAQARKYFRDCNVALFGHMVDGLIVSNRSMALTLAHARKIADGTPEDSRTLFCIEPLLVGAAIGLFALICLTQSGMRIGELQQIAGDKSCMKIGSVPRFNENSSSFNEVPTKLFFWQLYPKGGTERQSYPVTPYMQEALKVWMEVHERFCGRFKAVPPNQTYFAHARRFPGKALFVLQWKGVHLAAPDIDMCLDFLLLEHLCLDPQGKPARITAHVLRHGVAGYLRQQGVPLEDIAGLLHQVNIIVTDYYSQLSPQDLYAKVGPLLTRLGDVAEIDPTTLRTAGDIQRLGQEALKRFGALRHLPGGTCATFTACEIQFKCASCPAFIPDPTRRDEVHEKIASCARTVQFLEESGDHLQAEVQRAHGRNWERVEKEMEALAVLELASPPFESALHEFGINSLDELDEEWLLTLKQHPLLSAGGDSAHV